MIQLSSQTDSPKPSISQTNSNVSVISLTQKSKSLVDTGYSSSDERTCWNTSLLNVSQNRKVSESGSRVSIDNTTYQSLSSPLRSISAQNHKTSVVSSQYDSDSGNSSFGQFSPLLHNRSRNGHVALGDQEFDEALDKLSKLFTSSDRIDSMLLKDTEDKILEAVEKKELVKTKGLNLNEYLPPNSELGIRSNAILEPKMQDEHRNIISKDSFWNSIAPSIKSEAQRSTSFKLVSRSNQYNQSVDSRQEKNKKEDRGDAETKTSGQTKKSVSQKQWNELVDRLSRTSDKKLRKMEEITRKKEEELNEATTFTPYINSKSRQLTSSLSHLSDRIGTFVEDKKQKIETKRRILEDEEKKKTTFKPRLISRSRSSGRDIDTLIDWDKHRQEKLEEMRKGAEIGKLEGCTFKPDVSNRTKKIMAKVKAKTGRDVFDRNYYFEFVKQARSEMRIREAIDKERNKTPSITPLATNLTREEPVGDRLYKMAMESIRKKEQVRRQREEDPYHWNDYRRNSKSILDENESFGSYESELTYHPRVTSLHYDHNSLDWSEEQADPEEFSHLFQNDHSYRERDREEEKSTFSTRVNASDHRHPGSLSDSSYILASEEVADKYQRTLDTIRKFHQYKSTNQKQVEVTTYKPPLPTSTHTSMSDASSTSDLQHPDSDFETGSAKSVQSLTSRPIVCHSYDSYDDAERKKSKNISQQVVVPSRIGEPEPNLVRHASTAPMLNNVLDNNKSAQIDHTTNGRNSGESTSHTTEVEYLTDDGEDDLVEQKYLQMIHTERVESNRSSGDGSNNNTREFYYYCDDYYSDASSEEEYSESTISVVRKTIIPSKSCDNE